MTGNVFLVQHWELGSLEAAGVRSPVVLHSDEAARAILIALEPGESLGDHQVKEHAWVVVVGGEMVFTVAGNELPGSPGTLVRFEPGERHSVRSDGGGRLLLLLAPWPGEGHYRGEE